MRISDFLQLLIHVSVAGIFSGLVFGFFLVMFKGKSKI